MKNWIRSAIGGAIVLSHAASTSAQLEPDRMMHFEGARYYFCHATSRDAPRAIQILTEVVDDEARVTLYQMLAGIEAVAQPLPGRPWRDVRCSGTGTNNPFRTREEAENYREQWITAARAQGTVIVELAWPGTRGADARRSASKKKPTSPAATSGTPATPTGSTSSKYVEVQGPEGSIRLSPEVIARNEAAEKDYADKLAAYNAAKAEHEQKLRQHADNASKAAAVVQGHEQELAAHASEVAAAKIAKDQYIAATKPAAATAKGWMYCDARGSGRDKRRFYSQISEVTYIPGEVTIIDVMAKNRASFKAYIAGAHAVAFTTDQFVHCPYSTDTAAGAQSRKARDERGDANNEIQSVQTGWTPSS